MVFVCKTRGSDRNSEVNAQGFFSKHSLKLNVNFYPFCTRSREEKKELFKVSLCTFLCVKLFSSLNLDELLIVAADSS